MVFRMSAGRMVGRDDEIGRLLRLLDDADREFREHRPDAVVLIDYPGFHWHLAKRAKKHGIPVDLKDALRKSARLDEPAKRGGTRPKPVKKKGAR